MKKIIVILLSLSVLLTLVSCSTQTGNEERFHQGRRPSSDSTGSADSSNGSDISDAGADTGAHIECSCAILDVKIASTGAAVAPGTLAEVYRIPVMSDTSDIGRTLDDILNISCPNECLNIVFSRASDGTQRLVVVRYHVGSFGQCGELSVFEPSFASDADFYTAAESGKLSAKLLGKCYITFEECMYSSYVDEGTSVSSADKASGDILFASVGSKDSARSSRIFGLNTADTSSVSYKKLAVYEGIFERFNERLGLEMSYKGIA